MAALTLTQGADLVGDQEFRYRVAMAFYYVARDVYREPSDTVGHENRERFARSIVLQDVTAFLQYAALVATDPQVVNSGRGRQVDITDDEIIAAVTRMWDTLAGVPRDQPTGP